MARLIDQVEVAGKLGISAVTFRRRRPALDDEGFPPPCAPFSHRWSEDQVDAWINRQPTPADNLTQATPQSSSTGWSQKLKERLHGHAH